MRMNKCIRAQPMRGGKGGDGNLVALLSLNLLLLAFFILLNGISQYEEQKTRAVLKSVNIAFSGRLSNLESSPQEPVTLAPISSARRSLEDVGRLVQSMMPAVRLDAASRGPALRLELSSAALFRPGQTELQPGRGLLLDRLARAIMKRYQAGDQLSVEFLHGVPAGSMTRIAAAGPRSLELSRAGLFARLLTQRGLAPDMVSVGIVPGKPRIVQILVRLHQTDRILGLRIPGRGPNRAMSIRSGL